MDLLKEERYAFTRKNILFKITIQRAYHQYDWRKRSPEIIQFNHVIGIQSRDGFSLESTELPENLSQPIKIISGRDTIRKQGTDRKSLLIFLSGLYNSIAKSPKTESGNMSTTKIFEGCNNADMKPEGAVIVESKLKETKRK